MPEYYSEHFASDIQFDPPFNKYVDLRQSYFDDGMEYFSNFDPSVLDLYDVLGVEKEIRFELGGKMFVGYIDCLLRDKQTDCIIILDHKSAKMKFKKTGEVSKTDQRHFDDFKRQLYLYSIPIIEEYGKCDELAWNLFRMNKRISIEWNQNDFEEAKNWAVNTIKMIENFGQYNANPENYYYCHNLCSQRLSGCEFMGGCDDSLIPTGLPVGLHSNPE